MSEKYRQVRNGLDALRCRLARTLAHLLVLTFCVAQAPVHALEAPVKIVVPVPAGGSADALARLLAVRLGKRLQQPVIVENRPGAAGIIGTEFVIKSAPDGRTLLLSPTLVAANTVLFRLNFNPQTDLQPVVQIGQSDNFLIVPAALDVLGLADLKRLAQTRSGGLSCGAVGALVLDCERLRVALGGQLIVVPYAGVAPILTAVMGEHIDLAFADGSSVGTVAANPKLRVLAFASAKAPPAPFEKLPLFKDTWPGWVSTGFTGIFVPAATPVAIVERLNREVNEVLTDPELREAMERSGATLVGGKPEVLTKTMARKIEYLRRTAAEVGFQPAMLQ
jgi:tripartite-type tricarboxylate transporter receptor subunit TctC